MWIVGFGAGACGFYFAVLTPALTGVIIGAMVAQGLVWTKNQNSVITTVAAVMASMAAVAAVHGADYHFYQQEMSLVSPQAREFAMQVKQFQIHPEWKMPGEIREVLAAPDFDHQQVAALQVETFAEFMNHQAERGMPFRRVGLRGARRRARCQLGLLRYRYLLVAGSLHHGCGGNLHGTSATHPVLCAVRALACPSPVG